MCDYVVKPREKPYVPKKERKEGDQLYKPPGYWKKDKNKCVSFDNDNHDRLMGISK